MLKYRRNLMFHLVANMEKFFLLDPTYNFRTKMQIMMFDFEKPMIFDIGGTQVTVTVFKTPEHANIKFGIDAPRSMQVNREEIYTKKQEIGEN